MPSAQETETLAKIEERIGEELEELSEPPTADQTAFARDPEGRVTALSLFNKRFADLDILHSFLHLDTLHLRGNSVSSIQPLRTLERLRCLSLRDNAITHLQPLQELTNLQDLDLGHNSIVDIQPLNKLTSLRQLDLSYNQTTDIQALQELTNLQSLSLRSNSITDLGPMRELRRLESLDLQSNSIDDLDPAGTLTSLRRLDLSDNRLVEIAPLAQLTELRNLKLWGNAIVDLQPLEGLVHLESLDLRSNRIVDVQMLQSLTSLHHLNLSDNALSKVQSLTQLVKEGQTPRIILWDNPISRLPDEWLDGTVKLRWESSYYPKDRGVYLHGNPLQYPPIEILQQGTEAVASYSRSLVGAKRPLNEVRVLLVGEGGAGKTTLVRCLLGEKRNPEEDPTTGIHIRSWDISLHDENLTAHLWDFGGQEILHATHRFFLSTRSLYLVVLDGRREERPEYWLQHVKIYGESSPVLLILNKQDQNPGHDVERASLRRKYPNILGFFPTSCATGEGLDHLRRELLRALDDLRMRGSLVAENWLRVKDVLANNDADYLSVEAYRKLCRQEGILDEVPQNTLLRFLDQLGIVLYFEDFELAGTHVLKPEWLTQGVYRLLNSKTVADQEGKLRLSQIPELLEKRRDADFDYPPDKQQFLVGMIKKFELGYPLDDEWLLIPDQLPLQEPKELPFDLGSPPSYYVQYSFLPPSIFVRFLVKHHKDILEAWRSGIYLEDADLAARALVREDKAEGRISIWIDGEQKRDYLSTLRKTLRDLHSDFEGLESTNWIPLPDAPSYAVEYEELVGLEQMGEGTYKHGRSRRTYRVAELLNSVEHPEEREERLEKLERGGVYVHVENKPEIHAAAQAAAHATASVELKKEIHRFGSTLQVLREDLLDELEGKERENLDQELDRVHEALKQIESEPSPGKAKTSPAMERLSRFIEKLGDTSTRIGRAIQAVEDGVGYARDLARHYNEIAQWCGLPQVPAPLVGKE